MVQPRDADAITDRECHAPLTDSVHDPDGLMPGYLGTKDEAMKKLDLTDAEMNDIVEFLGTLTGEEVPTALRMDTSAP